MAGAMAMIKSLCGAPFRRSRSKASKLPPEQKGESNSDAISTAPSILAPPPPTTPQQITGSIEETRTLMAPPAEYYRQENMEALEITKELPLPPAMQMTAETGCGNMSSSNNNNNNLMKKSASTRSLSSSISMKLPRSMSSMARKEEIGEEKINNQKKIKLGKLKVHEDSVWMKTIILGEKCKVPDHEEEAVIYDGKGKRISTYHKKASSSFASMSSRQIDINPSHDTEKNRTEGAEEEEEFS